MFNFVIKAKTEVLSPSSFHKERKREKREESCNHMGCCLVDGSQHPYHDPPSPFSSFSLSLALSLMFSFPFFYRQLWALNHSQEKCCVENSSSSFSSFWLLACRSFVAMAEDKVSFARLFFFLLNFSFILRKLCSYCEKFLRSSFFSPDQQVWLRIYQLV